MNSKHYKRICIFNQDGIGDFVILLPTLRSLKSSMPESELILSVSPLQLPIAKTLEGKVIDGFIERRGENRFLAAARFFRELRRQKPDIFAEFTIYYSFPLGGLVADTELHSSYGIIPPVLRLLPTTRLPSPQSGHEVDRRMQILSYLGLRSQEISFDFPIPKSDLEKALSLIEEKGLGGRKLIALVPESKKVWKDWPAETLRGSINILTKDFGYKIVLFGKNNRGDTYGKNVVDLRGQTSMLVDAYLLRYSGLFDVIVGADTGMMHIAGAVNSNREGNYDYNVTGNLTVSLFGPTNPKMWKPYDPTGRYNRVVTPTNAPVSFEYTGNAPDRLRRNYMLDIPINRIVDGIEQQLAKITANQTRASAR